MSPRKANQPTLTRERIVDAAIALIDDSGIEHMSMRRIGAALGVDAKAIYYHVPNRAALYDSIADRILGSVVLPAASAEGPEETIVAAYLSYLEALMVHPRAIPLLGSRPLRSTASLRPVEALLGVLYDAGLEPTHALLTLDSLGYFVMGFAQAKAAALSGSDYVADSDSSRLHDLAVDEFPNMTRLTREGRFLGFDSEFTHGIRCLARALLCGTEKGPRLDPPTL
jgi:TetR/AcrR family transcriptional regulator, tetracycline repressor protein